MNRPDGGPPVPGIAVLAGYCCVVDGCDRPKEALGRNLTNVLRHRNKVHGLSHANWQTGIKQVQMQTVFWEKKCMRLFVVSRVERQEQDVPMDIQRLQEEFKCSQDKWTDSFQELDEPHHAAQMTPWLRRTGFWDHLAGLDRPVVLAAVAGPDTPDLGAIARACLDLVTRAHQEARQAGPHARLSRQDGKELNSVEGGRPPADPLRPLQNDSTVRVYSQAWERLLCYGVRLLGQTVPMAARVMLSSRQGEALARLEDASLLEPADLERRVLEASVSFIEQRLDESLYDSVLLSYLAGRGLAEDGSWREPTGMTSLMSAVTHVARLMIYLDVRAHADVNGHFGRHLHARVQGWMVNSSRGPMAELLSWRLYASAVAAATVPPAWTSWSADGQTVVFKHVELHLDDWRRLIRSQLADAGRILNNDLLLGSGRPGLTPGRLKDVMTETRPGFSFVADRRNTISPDWLIRQTQVRRLLTEGAWSGAAVSRYLGAATDFLEKMLLLVHLTGGLPARAPEIISLQHCNGEGRRNVFIHDGQVLLLTGYHKTLYAAGSRLVARFLPAAVGELLTTYLAVVLPFVRHLQTVEQRPVVRSWLWAMQKDGPWRADRLSEVMERETGLHLGQAFGVASWRHMAIAIDRRHLRGWFVEEEEEDTVNDLQASHSTRTANHSYANDGRNVLTDAQLDRYRQLSGRWHELIGLERVQPQSVAFRPRRPRDEELWQTLRRLHGPGAIFRPEQWEPVRRMADGKAQLVVVMRTGGGKSLLFQLGSLLPGAGVTVVILPLVVLRQDLVGKCLDLQVPHAEWPAEAPLTLVSVESACTEDFGGFLRRLHDQSRLDRIVLDEAHMVLTDSSYREALRQVRVVRRLPVPFVALTATLPPCQEVDLCEGLHLANPLLLRSSVDRPNLVYKVELGGMEDAVEVVRLRLQAMRDTHRMLCYVRSRQSAEELATLIGCQAYHAQVPDRAAVYRNWLQGKHRVLVGTSALSAGVDHPQVRSVVHVGPPSGAMAYSQEAGRAGRDGQTSEALVLLARRPSVQASEPDRRAMETFLSTDGCLRRVLTAYLDGGAGISCGAATPCSGCQESDDDLELGLGDALARDATRGQASDRAEFLDRLERSMQVCAYCPGVPSHAWCSGNDPWGFQRGAHNPAPHVGCWSCLCPRWGCDKAPGASCRWPRQMLRIAMAARCRQGEAWAESARREVLPPGRPAQVWQWLVRPGVLYGEPVFNANVVVDHVLRLWARDGVI